MTAINKQAAPQKPKNFVVTQQRATDKSNPAAPLAIPHGHNLVIVLSENASTGFKWKFGPSPQVPPPRVHKARTQGRDHDKPMALGDAPELYYFIWEASKVASMGNDFTVDARLERDESLGGKCSFKFHVGDPSE